MKAKEIYNTMKDVGLFENTINVKKSIRVLALAAREQGLKGEEILSLVAKEMPINEYIDIKLN